MKDTTYLENLQTEVKAMLEPFEAEKAKLEAQKAEAQAKINEISSDSTNLEELKALSDASSDMFVIDDALKNLEKLTRQAVSNFGLKAKMENRTIFYLGSQFEEKAAQAIDKFVKEIESIEAEANKEVVEFGNTLYPICQYLGGVVADYELDPVKKDWHEEQEERDFRQANNFNASTSFNKRKVVRDLTKILAPII